jgi:hypothetical protein
MHKKRIIVYYNVIFLFSICIGLISFLFTFIGWYWRWLDLDLDAHLFYQNNICLLWVLEIILAYQFWGTILISAIISTIYYGKKIDGFNFFKRGSAGSVH